MDEHNKQVVDWLVLHRTPGLSVNLQKRLLGSFDSVAEIRTADATILTQFGLKASSIRSLQQPDWQAIEHDLNWLEKDNHYVLTCLDPAYPSLLKQCPGSPLLLFVVGDIHILDELQICIVGSRNPSPAGKQIARRFSRQLSALGVVITSGLALGIDYQSHLGAIEETGKTVAVLGNGIDNIYPVRHRKLAEQISETGAIVSEFATGVAPLPQNFPQRNRIISGLSIGTLVVEAAHRSGSLITARYALEQGREVFAVPGSILNPMAAGCHRLLKQGAKLTEKVEDILEELRSLAMFVQQVHAPKKQAERELPGLNEHEQSLLGHMGFEPVTVDKLVERSGLTADVVSSMLLNMQLKGYIGSQTGGSYIRVAIE